MLPLPAGMELIKPACALVNARGVRGTGFLVSPERLLTCYHVVRDAADGHIVATFPHGQYEAAVEMVDAANDCALLRLNRPVPPGDARPLALSAIPADRGAAWDGYGFPAVTGQAGLLIDGRVQDPTGHDPALRKAVVLRSAVVTAGSRLQGFSGSPVLMDGIVIGQMRQIIPDATGGAQMAVIYACPATILADLARQRLGAAVPNTYGGLDGSAEQHTNNEISSKELPKDAGHILKQKDYTGQNQATIESLKKQLTIHRKNLNRLNERKAMYAMDVPPYVENQIDAIQGQIEKLQDSLNLLVKNS